MDNVAAQSFVLLVCFYLDAGLTIISLFNISIAGPQ
jgi:hypothetical protein